MAHYDAAAFSADIEQEAASGPTGRGHHSPGERAQRARIRDHAARLGGQSRADG